jgi:hypothetical protein
MAISSSSIWEGLLGEQPSLEVSIPTILGEKADWSNNNNTKTNQIINYSEKNGTTNVLPIMMEKKWAKIISIEWNRKLKINRDAVLKVWEYH